MGLVAAKSVGEYLSAVGALRKAWRVPARRELWFRAEDSAYRKTHLQPHLYPPRAFSHGKVLLSP